MFNKFLCKKRYCLFYFIWYKKIFIWLFPATNKLILFSFGIFLYISINSFPRIPNVWRKSANVPVNEPKPNATRKISAHINSGTDLKKLRKEIENELPKPFNGLFDFYKKVLPSLIKLAFDLDEYYRVKLPKKS